LRETAEREDVASIIAVLKSDAFRRIVHAYPGYDASLAGTISTLSGVVSP
jgi:hypothetical protein